VIGDIEHRLLSKCVHTGMLEELITYGVEEHHFKDSACAKVWSHLVEYKRQYNACPSIRAVTDAFPDWELPIVSDPLSYVRDCFFREVKRRMAIESLREVIQATEDERVNNIDSIFYDAARQLAKALPSSLVSQYKHADTRLAKYLERTSRGLTLGIPTFNELTLGIRPHEYVSIVGWQGSGKSSLLLHIFFSAYCEGYKPLLISLEMEASAILRKLDAMAARVEYRALKSGNLEKNDIERLQAAAEKAKNASNDIIILDNLGKATVDRVYAEAVKYRPDLVGIDYISLLDAPKTSGASLWERVTHITGQLKWSARSLRIPYFGVAQTNIASFNVGAQLDNIAYARSIGQDSDIVFGLHQTKEMREEKRMEVRILKNRDGDLCPPVLMHWDMEYMDFSEWSLEKSFAPRVVNGGA